jgi:hypothetical protein
MVIIMIFSFGYNAGLAKWGQSLQDQAMEDWRDNDELPRILLKKRLMILDI